MIHEVINGLESGDLFLWPLVMSSVPLRGFPLRSRQNPSLVCPHKKRENAYIPKRVYCTFLETCFGEFRSVLEQSA